MACLVEIWTMVGEKQTMHPWIIESGQKPGGEGDPRSRPAD
jgi:hypothetical protein